MRPIIQVVKIVVHQEIRKVALMQLMNFANHIMQTNNRICLPLKCKRPVRASHSLSRHMDGKRTTKVMLNVVVTKRKRGLGLTIMRVKTQKVMTIALIMS